MGNIKFKIGDEVEIRGKAKIIKLPDEVEGEEHYEVTINNEAKITTLPESAMFKLPEKEEL